MKGQRYLHREGFSLAPTEQVFEVRADQGVLALDKLYYDVCVRPLFSNDNGNFIMASLKTPCERMHAALIHFMVSSDTVITFLSASMQKASESAGSVLQPVMAQWAEKRLLTTPVICQLTHERQAFEYQAQERTLVYGGQGTGTVCGELKSVYAIETLGHYPLLIKAITSDLKPDWMAGIGLEGQALAMALNQFLSWMALCHTADVAKGWYQRNVLAQQAGPLFDAKRPINESLSEITQACLGQDWLLALPSNGIEILDFDNPNAAQLSRVLTHALYRAWIALLNDTMAQSPAVSVLQIITNTTEMFTQQLLYALAQTRGMRPSLDEFAGFFVKGFSGLKADRLQIILLDAGFELSADPANLPDSVYTDLAGSMPILSVSALSQRRLLENYRSLPRPAIA